MRYQTLLRTAWTFAFTAFLSGTGVTVFGQDGGGGGGGDGGNTGVAGISIDATGVLRVMQVDPKLAAMQRQAALQSRPRNELKTSPMRMVSLNRLESFVKKQLESGAALSDEVMSLAGLQRLEYVFYLPETKDIVIAGPADQWYADHSNRLVGLTNGRATLRLDDLVVALRAFAPGQGATTVIGCSIDPTPEGLKRMSQFHANVSANGINAAQLNSPAFVSQYMSGMRDALGYQTISIKGVPKTTHFAQVLVEADYRMKLIGIGLQDPMIPMTTWIQKTRPRPGANALQRWYFEADYSTVASNEDGTAMHLVGKGVKLSGELEGVSKDGSRQRSGKSGDAASNTFTKEFTEKFDAIADVNPVFNEMRNLFDISIAAAFIQDRGLYNKADWNLGIFGSEEKFSVYGASEVNQVETAINYVIKDAQLMTPIGGGVHIAARKLVDPSRVSVDSSVSETIGMLGAPKNLAADQWWWD